MGVKTSETGSSASAAAAVLVEGSSIEVLPLRPKETRREERFLEEVGRITVGVVMVGSGRAYQLDASNGY